MENHLEALERLGKLLDARVLTKEEFEREKARLLGGGIQEATIHEVRPRSRVIAYAVAGSLAVVVVGGGIAYSVYQSIAGKGYGGNEAVEGASQETARQLPEPARISITFADPTTCEPGPSLSELLGRIREAGAADAGSSLRLIYLAGTPNPLEVQTSLQDSGSQQVRLARLPVTARWQGLRLTELRTMDWDQGTGYQLHFVGVADGVLGTLREAGFSVETLNQPMTEGRNFIAVERAPGGAILTCITSKAHDDGPVGEPKSEPGGE